MTAIAGAPPAAQGRAGTAHYLNTGYSVKSRLPTRGGRQIAMLHDEPPSLIAGVASPGDGGGPR